MDPQDAVDLGQEAIRTCILVGGPILAASLLIGLVVSLMQSMTQLHDQSIAFVPKILLMLVAIAVCLPYLADRMIEFTKYSLEKPVVFQLASSDDDEDSEGQADSRFTFAWLSSSSQNSSKSNLAPPALLAPVKQVVPSMPMLRSARTTAQPQFRPQPDLQPRVASPFALPAFRSADSKADQPPEAPAVETKTF